MGDCQLAAFASRPFPLLTAHRTSHCDRPIYGPPPHMCWQYVLRTVANFIHLFKYRNVRQAHMVCGGRRTY